MSTTTPDPQRTCTRCGNSLHGYGPLALTCSTACRVALHRAKQREQASLTRQALALIERLGKPPTDK